MGQQFIRDTEDMLLKINLMKTNMVLEAKDKFNMEQILKGI